MELRGAGLKVGPAKYLEGLSSQNDAKSLMNDHRLLHSFWEEIVSGSPQTEVGAGWTADMILLAHDSLIRRIQALNPSFKHDSPLKQEVRAAVLRGVVPFLVVPNYVSVVGGRVEGREGDLDVVVREEKPSESIVIRITQALGENVHVIGNPQGPHDESFEPLYHLALIPVAMWDRVRMEETPLAAAMSVYRHCLSPIIQREGWRGAVLRGAGALRRRVHGLTLPEARTVGREVAASILSGQRPWEEPLGATVDHYWSGVRREGLRRLSECGLEGRELQSACVSVQETVDQWQQGGLTRPYEEAVQGVREVALRAVEDLKR